MDVPVAVTVELGRRNVRIAEVLRLGPGSVLELDKASGEPLDLYVNNRLIARGEAVVIGERYGIRLTEVVMNDESRKAEYEAWRATRVEGADPVTEPPVSERSVT